METTLLMMSMLLVAGVIFHLSSKIDSMKDMNIMAFDKVIKIIKNQKDKGEE